MADSESRGAPPAHTYRAYSHGDQHARREPANRALDGLSRG